nr:uncharacterized protein LOC123279846 isoform X2 [Equus asinus]
MAAGIPTRAGPAGSGLGAHVCEAAVAAGEKSPAREAGAVPAGAGAWEAGGVARMRVSPPPRPPVGVHLHGTDVHSSLDVFYLPGCHLVDTFKQNLKNSAKQLFRLFNNTVWKPMRARTEARRPVGPFCNNSDESVDQGVAMTGDGERQSDGTWILWQEPVRLQEQGLGAAGEILYKWTAPSDSWGDGITS